RDGLVPRSAWVGSPLRSCSRYVMIHESSGKSCMGSQARERTQGSRGEECHVLVRGSRSFSEEIGHRTPVFLPTSPHHSCVWSAPFRVTRRKKCALFSPGTRACLVPSRRVQPPLRGGVFGSFQVTRREDNGVAYSPASAGY